MNYGLLKAISILLFVHHAVFRTNGTRSHNGYWLVDGAVVNPIPISLTRALGADIVIAVDLQHDAHLMQQDLLSFNVSEENSENGDSLPWHARLKERLGSITTRRAVTAPTATEIMTTSIQVLENRLKRNRMAGDPPIF